MFSYQVFVERSPSYLSTQASTPFKTIDKERLAWQVLTSSFVTEHTTGLPQGHVQLAVHWIEGQPAPRAVLEILACTCPKICKLPKCVCMASGLKCTDMCKLSTCDNQRTSAESDDSSAKDEPSDNEDDDFWAIPSSISRTICMTMLHT